MAYNTKPIVTDVEGNPISQYYNKELDQYEPVEGQAGANKVVLYNADGTENNNLSLIPILDKLSQLTGTVIDEETRKSNELQRIELYNQILNMLETGQLKGEKGDKGDTGIGLNFLWQGTSLGVKLETDAEYVFVDLRGPQGPPGTIENLEKSHVVNALGYTPIKSVNNIEADEVGNIELNIDTSEIENRIGTLETDLNEHIKDIYENEVHGMRILDGKLEYWDVEEEKWKQIAGGGGSQVPLGNVVDFTAEPDDGKVILRWKDPEDIVVDGIVISKWAGTKILRKTGSYPANENDGVLVVDSGVRNQYEINGFVDTGLQNNIEYFYMAFPYTTDGLYTLDIANRVSAMPTDYDDLTGSPGSPFLIAGDMQEGFFGEVPSSELITGDALASQVGISQGNSQHSAAGWLKFAWKGKILFIAKKPIRNSISWDAINTAKCVYGDSGDKTVEIGGLTYKVRLMRALEPSNDPKTTASANSGTVNHYSEWNRLMCQIHEQAIDKSWDYPNNIENDIGILEHNLGSGRQGMYSDADLVVKSGDGRASWCQEMGTSTSYRLHRGYNGVSYSIRDTSSCPYSYFGWRPVLELVS